jgi:hypothetical protein
MATNAWLTQSWTHTGGRQNTGHRTAAGGLGYANGDERLAYTTIDAWADDTLADGRPPGIGLRPEDDPTAEVVLRVVGSSVTSSGGLVGQQPFITARAHPDK